MIESAVVGLVLTTVLFLKRFTLPELVCSAAVWVTFMHGQVADRMQEKQAVLSKPDVHCYKWSARYFLVKEFLWIGYFLLSHGYAALAGAGLFFLYPFWRKFYRWQQKKKSFSAG